MMIKRLLFCRVTHVWFSIEQFTFHHDMGCLRKILFLRASMHISAENQLVILTA